MAGLGEKLRNVADTIARGMYGDEVQAYKSKQQELADAVAQAEWLKKSRGWQEEEHPLEVERRRKADERGDYQFDRSKTEDTRQDTSFEQGQEDRTTKLARETQERQAAQEYVKRNFPGVSPMFINGWDDVKAMMGAKRDSASIKASEALAGLRGVQADAGGFRPSTTKAPKWTTADESRLSDAKLKLRNAVLNGVIDKEEAEAAWLQIQSQADRQKQAALDAEQAAIVTPGGANVDAGSLPSTGEPWQGLPYRLDRR